jgi:hypothetical protein
VIGALLKRANVWLLVFEMQEDAEVTVAWVVAMMSITRDLNWRQCILYVN